VRTARAATAGTHPTIVDMEWLGVDRRRLGTAVLVFGVVGLVLAAIVGTTLVAGVYAVRNLDDKIATAQSQMGASLTRLTLTIDSIAQSIDATSATLGTARDGAAHAAGALNDVADSTGSLADALDVTIVGQQPFTSAVASLRSLETRVRVFQDDALTLAANLDQNVTDTSQIAGEVRDMRTQSAELAGAFSGFAGARDTVSFAEGGVALAGLLTLWEAILAVAIAWAGMRLRRHAAVGTASAAAASGADAPAPDDARMEA
jgi:outer membrane murein-binding lipoprotein Lpp